MREVACFRVLALVRGALERVLATLPALIRPLHDIFGDECVNPSLLVLEVRGLEQCSA